MNIRNRERKFLLTVRGRDEIAKLCPNGDLSQIGELLRSSTQTDVMRKIVVIMARDYEDHEKYYNEAYNVDYLTDDDLLMLTMEEFRKISDEASDAFLEGMGVSVEIEEKKGKKTGKTKGQS